MLDRPVTLDVAGCATAGHVRVRLRWRQRAAGRDDSLQPHCLVMLVAGLVRRRLARARRSTGAVGVVRPGTPLVAALLMAGATTVVYSLVVPPFEPPDELAHLQYARFVATTGTLPSAVPPPDSEWRAASYEFVQQPLYYVGAAAVLRAAGLATPGPVLVLNPRSRMQPGGTEPTIFQHGAAPAPATGHQALRLLRLVSLLMALGTTWLIARLLTTVTSDPLVIATVAGGLGLIPAVVRRDGRGLDRSAGDAPGRRRNACRSSGSRTDECSANWLLLTGAADRRGVRGQGHGDLPRADGRARVRAGCRRTASASARGSACSTGSARTLWPPCAPVLLILVGIVAGSGVDSRPRLDRVRRSAGRRLQEGDPRGRRIRAARRARCPGPREFWAQMRVMVFEPFWARFGSLGAGPFPGSRSGSSTVRRRCCSRVAGGARGRRLEPRGHPRGTPRRGRRVPHAR